MANHVRNLIKFDCPKEKLEEIYHSIYTEEDGYGGVDFRKIVPPPTDMEEVRCVAHLLYT